MAVSSVALDFSQPASVSSRLRAGMDCKLVPGTRKLWPIAWKREA